LHRAAFWHAQGVLDVDPEPEPPAPAALAPVVCYRCNGTDHGCPVCGGAGVASLAAQAAALVAAATACARCIGAEWDDESGEPRGLCRGPGIEPVGACDRCGGPLDDDAQTDDALITLCGECVAAMRAECFEARQAARALPLTA
jgi:hypothetical protein